MSDHRLRLAPELGIGLALLAEGTIFALLSPYFFTPENLLNVSLQVSIIAIVAAGMTFVILTAGIDLSVGSVVALAGIAVTSVLRLDAPFEVSFPLAVFAAISVGALSGFVAGVCITSFNVTPFIVTLALMTVWRGVAFVYTEGRPVWELPQQFSIVGNGRILALPIPTIFMLVIYTISHVPLTRTRFGRYVYAVGGNLEAARLAGIRTNKILVEVYVLCGMLAALAFIPHELRST